MEEGRANLFTTFFFTEDVASSERALQSTRSPYPWRASVVKNSAGPPAIGIAVGIALCGVQKRVSR